MAAPRVSVIIPTHNRANLLPTAIHSALAQTVTDIEVIVVDDGSSDNTQQVLAGFKDPRVRCLRNSPGKGAAGARNAGIAAATGEYIAFLDDDDQWFVEKLTRQLAALEAAPAGTGLCLTGYLCYNGPHLTEYIGGKKWFDLLDFRRGVDAQYRLIVTTGWLVKRDLLTQAGLFDASIPVWEDWEMALRLNRLCRFTHVDEPLFLFNRLRPPGQTENRPARGVAMRKLMDKHHDFWSPYPEVMSRHCFVVAMSERGTAPVAETRKWLEDAVRHYPQNADARRELRKLSLPPVVVKLLSRLGLL